MLRKYPSLFLLALMLLSIQSCGDGSELSPEIEKEVSKRSEQPQGESTQNEQNSAEAKPGSNAENEGDTKQDQEGGKDTDSEPATDDVCLQDPSAWLVASQRFAGKAQLENPMGLKPEDQLIFRDYDKAFLEFDTAGFEAYHDASAYGVAIEEAADVASGEWYWKVIGVHHLLPNENRSKHHVFVEVLDDQGDRIRDQDSHLQLFTNDGEVTESVKLDKPDYEPFGNVALYKSNKANIGILKAGGFDGLKSERVKGLSSAHADEVLPDGSKYNTYGHHSFYLVYKLTQRPFRSLTLTLPNSSSLKLADLKLFAGSEEIAAVLEGDGVRFDGLRFDTLSGEAFELRFGAGSKTGTELRFPKDVRSMKISCKS